MNILMPINDTFRSLQTKVNLRRQNNGYVTYDVRDLLNP